MHVPASQVLPRLRAATRYTHRGVEDALDLVSANLTSDRLVAVLTRLGGFWRAAEQGLDRWADRHPDDAALAGWPGRRRAGLYPRTARAWSAAPVTELPGPELSAVTGTGTALGRLYVLEGSTLGGRVISRHLAGLPGCPGPAGWECFDPYGARAGAMWRGFTRQVEDWVAAGGDADEVEAGAVGTFDALADWCRPLREAG